MSILEQIRALDEKKAALLESGKKEALAQAQQAVQALNELGFPYRLVEGEGEVTSRPRTQSPRASGERRQGSRRTGIREMVLRLVQEGDGTTAADIRKALGLEDKSDAQAVSNALAALKKQGTITLENGIYTAV